MHIKRILIGLGCLGVLSFHASFWIAPKTVESKVPFEAKADSILNTLSTDEMLPYLIFSRAPSSDELNNLIPGGVERDFATPNEEGSGLMTFSSIENCLFSLEDSSLTSLQGLNAIESDSQFYEVAAYMAHKCANMGVDLVFGPDVSLAKVDQEASTRIGENHFQTAHRLRLMLSAFEQQGVLLVPTNVPGVHHSVLQNGTAVDDRTFNELQTEALFMLRELIDHDVKGLAFPKVVFPAIDTTKKPLSESSFFLNDFLVERMHFSGIRFPNSPKKYGKTESVEALRNGLDILWVDDYGAVLKQLQKAVSKGQLSDSLVRIKARKVLGLALLAEDLQSKAPNAASFFPMRHAARTGVMLRNDSDLPITRTDTLRLGLLVIGEHNTKALAETMAEYAAIQELRMPRNPTKFQLDSVLRELDRFDHSFVAVFPRAKPYDYAEFDDVLRYINESGTTTLLAFGNPQSHQMHWNRFAENQHVLLFWGIGDAHQRVAAQIVFGARDALGQLPLKLTNAFPVGLGLHHKSKSRLAFAQPEEAGLNTEILTKIDSIVNYGIEEQAFPGCQVVVARKGMLVWNKSYGHHTYQAERPVLTTDLYDVASVTKIAASMISFMYLDDMGVISLDQRLGDLLPDIVSGTPYEQIILRDMLAHQAGLKSWIPFYQETLGKTVPRYDVYSLVGNETYPYQVAENMYIHRDYPDSILHRITETPLGERGKYLYSDLGYYFIQQIVEKYTKMPLDQFVEQTFYAPIGMGRTLYNPLKRFDQDEIIPTERDVTFRKQLIHGYVHDPGAAMMGGVAGHAGVFSTATDMAKLMEMYMRFGSYGGMRFLQRETIASYTKCQYCADPSSDNRRAAGFDKPVMDGGPGPTCDCVSYNSFGHTGFTGTIAWADPDEEVVFVFLSNRIHPSASNKKLIRMGTRTEIMEVIYDAISD